jgi:hypothetical protein
MSPARLSNYVSGRGPRTRPVGRPGTTQNSNGPGRLEIQTIQAFSGLGRAGWPECTPIAPPAAPARAQAPGPSRPHPWPSCLPERKLPAPPAAPTVAPACPRPPRPPQRPPSASLAAPLPPPRRCPSRPAHRCPHARRPTATAAPAPGRPKLFYF